MTKKMIVTGVALVAVVLLGTKGKGLLMSRQVAVANTALPTLPLKRIAVVSAKQGSLEERQSFVAQVASEQAITLSTKLSGYIMHLGVAEADRVKAGQPLLSIDGVELQSSITTLQATRTTQMHDLAVTQRIHERNQKLHSVGGLAKEKLEISALALQAKRSQLSATEQKIAQLTHQRIYLDITAPFDGVIDSVLVHQGDLAGVGKPLVRMSSGKKRLIFSYARSTPIKPQQTVWLNGKQIGTIKACYTTTANGLSQAEVALTQPIDLPVGSSIAIEVQTRVATGCLLPSQTIVHKQSGSFVMGYTPQGFVPRRVDIVMQNSTQLLLASCPQEPIAYGNEVLLAQLPAYGVVEIIKQ